MSGTFESSCQHWSEKKRHGMEQFYALASMDYQYLAEAVDWRKWLQERQNEAGNRSLKILDVACGSGKFPSALTNFCNLKEAHLLPIHYALLDPSSFSISETRKVLRSPFIVKEEFQTTLQDLVCKQPEFDVVWAIHALYAVPKEEIESALYRFRDALKGKGFIAHASESSHYLRFYRNYLKGFNIKSRQPFCSAEDIIQALKKMNLRLSVKTINYEHRISKNSKMLAEGYLQRCIFDDGVDLETIIKNPISGEYLNACLKGGAWHFDQEVKIIFIENLQG